MKKNRKRTRSAGFTLVELAIVLIIIGLLTGGILKGTELVTNAQVRATIRKTDEVKTAMLTFQDSYKALPGDYINATTRLPGCTAAVNCLNGNANNYIGNAVANWSHDDQSGLNTEPTQFWKHLVLANLMTGVNPSATTVAWEESHPPIPIGGGMHIFYSSQITPGQEMNGHNLYLRPTVSGDAHAHSGSFFGYSTMTPGLAFRIDIKIDDGNGQTGYVRVDDNHQRCTNRRGVYVQSYAVASCLMAVRVY